MLGRRMAVNQRYYESPEPFDRDALLRGSLWLPSASVLLRSLRREIFDFRRVDIEHNLTFASVAVCDRHLGGVAVDDFPYRSDQRRRRLYAGLSWRQFSHESEGNHPGHDL